MFLAAFEQHLADSQGSIRRVGQLSILAAVPLLLGHHVIEAARMADEWPGILDANLQRMVMTSSSGMALALRVIGCGVLWLGLRRNTSHGRVVTMTATGTLLVAASFTAIGHTAVHHLRILLAPLLVAHVVIVAFWLGALLPLYLACARETPQRAGRLVEAFSAAATWLVPCIAIVGAVMAFALVPGLATFREPYGELLLGKVAGFSLLMGIAALNRWKLGPAIATGDRGGVRLFRRTLAMEYAAIIAIVTVTTVMTTFFSPEDESKRNLSVSVGPGAPPLRATHPARGFQ